MNERRPLITFTGDGVATLVAATPGGRAGSRPIVAGVEPGPRRLAPWSHWRSSRRRSVASLAHSRARRAL